MERLQFPRKWYIYRKIPTVTQVFCPEHLVTESRFLFYLSRHTQTDTYTDTHTGRERHTHTHKKERPLLVSQLHRKMGSFMWLMVTILSIHKQIF